jgi:ER membrane protein complex subunit 2
LILAPQNPFYFLQFAEIAYTAGDVPLATKMFLVTIELLEKDASVNDLPKAAGLRAWWGLKLVSLMVSVHTCILIMLFQCCRRILSGAASLASASNTPEPQNILLLDELSTERVLATYSQSENMKYPEMRKIIYRWMTPPAV